MFIPIGVNLRLKPSVSLIYSVNRCYEVHPLIVQSS